MTWHHQVKCKDMKFTAKQMRLLFFIRFLLHRLSSLLLFCFTSNDDFAPFDWFHCVCDFENSSTRRFSFDFFVSLAPPPLRMTFAQFAHDVCERAARCGARRISMYYYCMWCMKFSLGVLWIFLEMRMVAGVGAHDFCRAHLYLTSTALILLLFLKTTTQIFHVKVPKEDEMNGAALCSHVPTFDIFLSNEMWKDVRLMCVEVTNDIHCRTTKCKIIMKMYKVKWTVIADHKCQRDLYANNVEFICFNVRRLVFLSFFFFFFFFLVFESENSPLNFRTRHPLSVPSRRFSMCSLGKRMRSTWYDKRNACSQCDGFLFSVSVWRMYAYYRCKWK